MAEPVPNTSNKPTPGTVNWFSDDLLDSREMIDTLPRILFLFAMLFLIPRFYWNYKVGGILQSYLRYMLELIQILKGKLEKIPNAGMYGGQKLKLASVFDEDSSLFSKDTPYSRVRK